MIEISIDNRVILVDGSISLELNNNMFSNELLSSNFSYPFTLPATSHNLAALNFPYDLSSTPTSKKIEAILRLDGHLTFPGQLVIIDANRLEIKCSFQLSISAIADKLKQPLNSPNLAKVSFDFGLRSSMWKYVHTDITPPGAGAPPVLIVGDKYGFEFRYFVSGSVASKFYFVVKHLTNDGGYAMFAKLAELINKREPIPYVEDPSRFNHTLNGFYKTYEIPGDTNFLWYRADVNGTLSLSGSNYTFLGFSEQDVSELAFKNGYDGCENYLDPAFQLVSEIIAIPFFESGVPWMIFFEAGSNGRKMDVINSFAPFLLTVPDHQFNINGANFVLHDEDSIVGGGQPNTAYRLYAGSKAYFEASSNRLRDILPTGLIPDLDDTQFCYFPVYNPIAIENTDDIPNQNFPEYRGYLNYNGAQAVHYSCAFPRLYSVLDFVWEYLNLSKNNDCFSNPEAATLDCSQLNDVALFHSILDEMPLALNRTSTYRTAYNINMYDKLPNITIEDFLNKVRRFFFLYIDINLNNQKVDIMPLADLLSSTAKESALNWDNKIFNVATVKQPQKGGYKVTFAFDPSDELVKELVPNFDKSLELEPVETNLDLPENPFVGAYCLVKEENRFYSFTFDEDNNLGWFAGPINYRGIDIGDGEEDYSLLSSSVFMYEGLNTIWEEDYTTSRNWRVPYVKQKAKSVFFNNAAEYPLRFIFNPKERATDSLGRDYSLGSPDNKDLTDFVKFTSFTLDYAQNSLIHYFGASWLQFLNNAKTIEAEVMLTAADLSLISFSKLIKFGAHYYIIKSVRIAFPVQGLSVVELVQLPS